MENKDKNIGSLYTVGAALLLCVAAFCPVNIQDALAILTACVFGFQGAGAVGLFIVLGMIGLPVLPNGTNYGGGTAVLTGLYGGFIWGIFLASLLCGLLMGNVLKKKEPAGLLEKAEAAARAGKTDWFFLIKLLLILIAAYVVVQAPGIIWYVKCISRENLQKGKLPISYGDAFMLCTLRNIPFLIVKLAVSYPLVIILRKLFEPKRS